MGFVDVMSMIGAVVIIALALAATYFASRWYAKRAGVSGAGRYVKVIDKAGLSQGSAVYIVKVDGGYHMLGVSDKAVSYLHELPGFIEDDSPPPGNALSFSQILKGVMGQGKRGGGG
ncbi:MAG: flagellar biosynthetic protein FliO [Oscillospiraceae bacterium]|nr:flagellar biosynthetic protein FliO [Oscillospiraceae bacterium]